MLFGLLQRQGIGRQPGITISELSRLLGIPVDFYISVAARQLRLIPAKERSRPLHQSQKSAILQ